jgi:predicted metalloprotease
MLWRNRRGSGNIIDRRGMGGGLGVVGLIIGAIIYTLSGGDPADYLAQNTGSIQRQEATSKNNDEKEFISVVLADTEDVWNNIFQKNNFTYREPSLVLFSNMVRSACGNASSSVGPFYCPADQQVYLDLGFFKQLSNSLGAGGDFAQAYVIAHEVGHHVQNLLGIADKVRGQQQGLDKRGSNRLSVMMELQADCLAGVWAKQTEKTKNVLETGDIEEAMNAASAVGDDRLQQAARGEVVPDSFTHGTSEQRIHAFRQGFENGELGACLATESTGNY